MQQFTSSNSNIYIHALMLLAILLAASSFPVGAAIADKLPAEILMFLRFLLAAIMFAPFVFLKHGLKLPSRRALLNYSILSIPLVVFFWCMFESLRYTSVLNTGALYTVVPAITAIFALLINREVTRKVRLSGLILGIVGALWIVFRGDLNAFLSLALNYGDFIFLLGCIFLGLYNPLIKRIYSGEPMEIMTFWVMLWGSFWLLLLSAKNITHIEWATVGEDVYLGIIYLSLFSTLITFLIINFSTVRIGATRVSAYGFLTPMFVIIMSISFGLEAFEIVIVPGLLLITIAMFLIQKDVVNKEIEK